MRICIIPEYPLELMTGGLQIQAREIFECLQRTGMDVCMFSWSSEADAADLYHIVGAPDYLTQLVGMLKASGKKCICLLLTGGRCGFVQILRTVVSRRILGRKGAHMVGMCDAITVRTARDAIFVRRAYGIRPENVHVIPVIVHDGYFHAQPDRWQSLYGRQPFVLSVGSVQVRKNQLMLVQVCNSLRLPVVLIGGVLPGDEDYGRTVEQEMRTNQEFGGRWLPPVDNHDELLRSAYAACKVYVQLSSQETQPACVLQAMAARKPILIGDAPYTDNEPFRSLSRTSTRSSGEVAQNLLNVWTRGEVARLSDEHRAENVARLLLNLYKQVLRMT